MEYKSCITHCAELGLEWQLAMYVDVTTNTSHPEEKSNNVSIVDVLLFTSLYDINCMRAINLEVGDQRVKYNYCWEYRK